jgi:hypothetical protein
MPRITQLGVYNFFVIIICGKALGGFSRAAFAPKSSPSCFMGDLHAGNLLVASNNELVAIDPTPALPIARQVA